jgi:FtsZ-binding cell division protein ZapB
MERSCVAELEEANAQLRAETDEAHAKIAEVESRENVLKSNYGSLCRDYENLEIILAALQGKKTEADIAHRDKLQKFC